MTTKKNYKKTKVDIRIDKPHLNKEKFKEILLYILIKVGSRPNIGEGAICKLLYFIDFDYYERYEEQLTGIKYIKKNNYPIPVEFKTVIGEMITKEEITKVKSKYFKNSQIKYLAIREPDLLKLKNARELSHIDWELARLGDKTEKELNNCFCEEVPCIIAKDNEAIKYEAVFYRTVTTSVRSYDEDDD